MIANSDIEKWDVTRLAGELGAEIRGVNLAQAGEKGITEVERLLNEHMAIFLPGQNLSADEHLALRFATTGPKVQYACGIIVARSIMC